MEHLYMKVNKSKLARDMGVDRRTIDKYLNGFIPKTKRNKPSKIDEFYPIIASLFLPPVKCNYLISFVF